jgi:hypothetical protein
MSGGQAVTGRVTAELAEPDADGVAPVAEPEDEGDEAGSLVTPEALSVGRLSVLRHAMNSRTNRTNATRRLP